LNRFAKWSIAAYTARPITRAPRYWCVRELKTGSELNA
jgi:hypothetical protein